MYTVIRGLGPVGLAFALVASRYDQKKHPVIAITDREAYTRQQMFLLEDDVVNFIRELVGNAAVDKLIEEKLLEKKPVGHRLPNEKRWTIQICILEQLLFAALKCRENVKIVQIPHYDADAVSINWQQNTLTVHKTVHAEYDVNELGQYPISCLVTATGRQEQSEHLAYPFTYYSALPAPFTTHHATVTYTVYDQKKTSLIKLGMKDGARETGAVDIKKLKAQGWEFSSTPEARIFEIGYWPCKFYIGAECPGALKNNPEEIHQWALTILENYFPKNVLQALALTPDQIAETTRFELLPKVANFDCRQVDSNPNVFVFLAGEGRQSAHYQTAGGVVAGLREARAFKQFMQSGQNSQAMAAYNNTCHEFNMANLAKMQTLDNARVNDERNASVNVRNASNHDQFVEWLRENANKIIDEAVQRQNTGDYESLWKVLAFFPVAFDQLMLAYRLVKKESPYYAKSREILAQWIYPRQNENKVLLSANDAETFINILIEHNIFLGKETIKYIPFRWEMMHFITAIKKNNADLVSYILSKDNSYRLDSTILTEICTLKRWKCLRAYLAGINLSKHDSLFLLTILSQNECPIDIIRLLSLHLLGKSIDIKLPKQLNPELPTEFHLLVYFVSKNDDAALKLLHVLLAENIIQPRNLLKQIPQLVASGMNVLLFNQFMHALGGEEKQSEPLFSGALVSQILEAALKSNRQQFLNEFTPNLSALPKYDLMLVLYTVLIHQPLKNYTIEKYLISNLTGLTLDISLQQAVSFNIFCVDNIALPSALQIVGYFISAGKNELALNFFQNFLAEDVIRPEEAEKYLPHLVALGVDITFIDSHIHSIRDSKIFIKNIVNATILHDKDVLLSKFLSNYDITVLPEWIELAFKTRQVKCLEKLCEFYFSKEPSHSFSYGYGFLQDQIKAQNLACLSVYLNHAKFAKADLYTMLYDLLTNQVDSFHSTSIYEKTFSLITGQDKSNFSHVLVFSKFSEANSFMPSYVQVVGYVLQHNQIDLAYQLWKVLLDEKIVQPEEAARLLPTVIALGADARFYKNIQRDENINNEIIATLIKQGRDALLTQFIHEHHVPINNEWVELAFENNQSKCLNILLSTLKRENLPIPHFSTDFLHLQILLRHWGNLSVYLQYNSLYSKAECYRFLFDALLNSYQSVEYLKACNTLISILIHDSVVLRTQPFKSTFRQFLQSHSLPEPLQLVGYFLAESEKALALGLWNMILDNNILSLDQAKSSLPQLIALGADAELLHNFVARITYEEKIDNTNLALSIPVSVLDQIFEVAENSNRKDVIKWATLNELPSEILSDIAKAGQWATFKQYLVGKRLDDNATNKFVQILTDNMRNNRKISPKWNIDIAIDVLKAIILAIDSPYKIVEAMEALQVFEQFESIMSGNKRINRNYYWKDHPTSKRWHDLVEFAKDTISAKMNIMVHEGNHLKGFEEVGIQEFLHQPTTKVASCRSGGCTIV